MIKDIDYEKMKESLDGFENLKPDNKDNCFYYDAEILNSDGSFPYISYLEIEGEWDDEYLDLLNKNKIQGLSIDNSFSQNENTNIDFFNHLPSLKLLMLTNFAKDKNFLKLDGYECIKNIEVLVLTASLPKKQIDYSYFNKLRECKLYSGSTTGSIGLEKGNKTIFLCKNLKILHIHEYKDTDFIGFDELTKLEHLSLTASSLKSIKGIEKLDNLKSLELINSTKIEDFTLIGEVNSLNTVSFKRVKGKNFIEALSHVRNLHELLLENCGEIVSIKPLKNCQKLTKLSIIGSTNILDGDLEFLKELSQKGVEIYFNDRKHYNIKYKDL